MKKKPSQIKALGKLLRKNREELNLTLKIAAKQSGVPFGYLATVERGEVKRPKLVMIERLCDIYGLDKDAIVNMAGKIPQSVYWKIVDNPQLVAIIRDMAV